MVTTLEDAGLKDKVTKKRGSIIPEVVKKPKVLYCIYSR